MDQIRPLDLALKTPRASALIIKKKRYLVVFQAFRKTECTGGEYSLEMLYMIKNEHKCQEACHEEEFCKSYIYDAFEARDLCSSLL